MRSLFRASGDTRALTSVLATLTYGAALIDRDNRYRWVNPTGAELLGAVDASELVGMRREWQETPAPVSLGGGLCYCATRADGEVREFDADVQEADFDGETCLVVFFRDVTERHRAARRVLAMARIAAAVTYGQPLQQTLDAIAGEVRSAANLLGCIMTLRHNGDRAPRAVGSAGLPATVPAALLLALRDGAPSLVGGAGAVPDLPRVVPDVLTRLRRDRTWAPVARAVEGLPVGAVMGMPLRSRDQLLGVLTAWFPAGRVPTSGEIDFLVAMGDQAAMATASAELAEAAEEHAVLEDRQRLARDLHDSVSQTLFSMTMHARAAQLALGAAGIGPEEPAAESVRELRVLASSAHAEMRVLIHELRPDAGQDGSLGDRLVRRAAALSKRAGVPVDVRVPDELLPLGRVAQGQLYRLLVEAATNAVKHARARRIEISVTCDGALVVGRVRDDGVGFDMNAEHTGHFGLLTMAERARRLDAELDVRSARGAGTTVEVRVRPRADRAPQG